MKKELKLLFDVIQKAETIFGRSYLNNPIFETIGKKEGESERIKVNTPYIIRLYLSSKTDLNKSQTSNETRLSKETLEFYQLIIALPKDEQDPFLERIKEKLRSKDLSLFTSSYHEALTRNRYLKSKTDIKHIEEGERKTPDFLAEGKTPFYIECKALLSKETLSNPEIEALCKRIQKLLAKKKVNGIIGITLSTKKVSELTQPILHEVDSIILTQKPFSKVADNFDISFFPIKITGEPKISEVQIQKNEFELGRFEFDLKGQTVIGISGVRILPLTTHDYSSSLRRQINKSKAQFESEHINVLHVQFPYIKLENLINLIEGQTKIIFDTLEGSSINALIIEFPYAIANQANNSKFVPDLSLPFLNSAVDTQQLLGEEPFWINQMRIVETKENLAAVYLEFEVEPSLKLIFNGIITQDLKYQIRFYLINNTLLIQYHESGLLHSTRIELPASTILAYNKIAFNAGSDSVSINGSIFRGKITSHNNK